MLAYNESAHAFFKVIPHQLLDVKARLDFYQIGNALHFVDRGAANRAQRFNSQSERALDDHINDAEISLARSAALEAVEFGGRTFFPVPALTDRKKASELISSDQERALISICL